ncbi:MAG: response regulator transcription factor [Flavobacteriaceae bacterium]|nr:response regulator transcription factor [Flavobacteriaceae bacterium]
MLKAVIIDDEPKAIQSLKWELDNFKKEIRVIATFNDPKKGISFLTQNNIDCLFLDIEMPTMDGFQLLEKLENKNFAVVITTAYNEYAIKAIKNEAIDYLLKPIDSDELEQTLKKIIKHKNNNTNTVEILEKTLSSFNQKLNQRKITINTDGKLIFLNPDDILFVASDGNYSTIYTSNDKKIVVTKKLKEIEALLPSDVFFRIHNSYIISLTKIKEFIKTDGYVILDNNHKIPVSRQRKSTFLNKL